MPAMLPGLGGLRASRVRTRTQPTPEHGGAWQTPIVCAGQAGQEGCACSLHRAERPPPPPPASP
eukprot:5935506-Alexandrium_andersonii.AAC.1